MDEGHDLVGTYRKGRQDPLFRKVASKMVNKITNRITKLNIRDYGCMLRGYSRRIVEIINVSRESTTFIPALGQKFAANPIEIPVAHRERGMGPPSTLFQLIRLNFDLMTVSRSYRSSHDGGDAHIFALFRTVIYMLLASLHRTQPRGCSHYGDTVHAYWHNAFQPWDYRHMWAGYTERREDRDTGEESVRA